jgi:hypothetical protein
LGTTHQYDITQSIQTTMLTFFKWVSVQLVPDKVLKYVHSIVDTIIIVHRYTLVYSTCSRPSTCLHAGYIPHNHFVLLVHQGIGCHITTLLWHPSMPPQWQPCSVPRYRTPAACHPLSATPIGTSDCCCHPRDLGPTASGFRKPATPGVQHHKGLITTTLDHSIRNTVSWLQAQCPTPNQPPTAPLATGWQAAVSC